MAKEDNDIAAAGLAAGTRFGHATTSLRSNFSIAHLKIAVRAAQEALKIEIANKNSEHGPWFEEMMMHVPVAIVMSAAAIEARVNEWAQDVIDNPDQYAAKETQLILIRDLEKLGGNGLERFKKLCLYLGSKPGSELNEWREVSNLILFRNHLMHFKPAWTSSDDPKEEKLVKALKHSPFRPYAPYAEKPFFPYVLMTYGCARWAVSSAVDFITKYSSVHNFTKLKPSLRCEFSLPDAR